MKRQQASKIRANITPYIKNLAAMLLVKFTFYLLISIIYVWILVSLGFQEAFDWNLSFLITISLLLFSMLFEKPSQVVVKEKMRRRSRT